MAQAAAWAVTRGANSSWGHDTRPHFYMCMRLVQSGSFPSIDPLCCLLTQYICCTRSCCRSCGSIRKMLPFELIAMYSPCSCPCSHLLVEHCHICLPCEVCQPDGHHVAVLRCVHIAAITLTPPAPVLLHLHDATSRRTWRGPQPACKGH